MPERKQSSACVFFKMFLELYKIRFYISVLIK